MTTTFPARKGFSRVLMTSVPHSLLAPVPASQMRRTEAGSCSMMCAGTDISLVMSTSLLPTRSSTCSGQSTTWE